jgi:ribose 5-phosphate isomerase
MNKSSIAKQKLVEYINSIEVPIPIANLYAMMSRDMTRIEFENTITELHNGRKATMLVVKEMGQCIIGISDTQARRAKKEMDDIKRILTARRASG